MFVLLKVQSLQLSFRPAGVSLDGGGGARPPSAPLATPLGATLLNNCFMTKGLVVMTYSDSDQT